MELLWFLLLLYLSIRQGVDLLMHPGAGASWGSYVLMQITPSPGAI